MGKNRHFSLTIFQKDFNGEDFIAAAQKLGCEYARCQLEKCPDTERLHLQACIGFKNARAEQAIRKAFPKQHVEVSHLPRAAWDYCGKEDTRAGGPWQHGMPPKAQRNVKGDVGARNMQLVDIGAVAALEQGAIRIEDFKKVHCAIQDYKAMRGDKPQNLEELDNYWYWGEPGTGKSHRARDLVDREDLYVKQHNRFWDGYAGEHTVLIDDLGQQTDGLVNLLKQWADKYAFRPEVKGGTLCLIRPRRLFVTSNYPPRDIFQREQDVQAIERRFKICHF